MPAATDTFAQTFNGLQSPASSLALVTPDNANDLAYVTRALRAGGAGDIKVTTVGGSTVVIPSVAAGETLPYRVSRVWATGTTATGIVAIW